MRKFFQLFILLAIVNYSLAQKKPLDHNVYDGWQSITERAISNDGRYVAYVISPQEGDGTLVIQSGNKSYKKEIARGYSFAISDDSRFLVCRIKAPFHDTRDAKIKKKKADEMPKDSLAIINLGTDSVRKIAGVKTYRMPEKGGSWLAYLFEKGFPETSGPKAVIDSATQILRMTHIADSLLRIADSLRNKVAEAKIKGMSVLQAVKKDGKKPDGKGADDNKDEGTLLVLRDLSNGIEKRFLLVKEYVFSKNGNRLIVETTKKNSDSTSQAKVLWLKLPALDADTIMRGFNETKSYTMDDSGTQVAFVAERDSASKELRKFFKLWYYRTGMDTASLVAAQRSSGVDDGMTVSEYYSLHFSKSGKRLFMGIAPIRPLKDTTVPDFEKAAVDVWNYHDDDLQPVQLKNLDRDLHKSYVAVWNVRDSAIVPLANESFPDVLQTADGDGAVFYSTTDTGRRVARQWQGYVFKDLYAIDPVTGIRKPIGRNVKGNVYPSSTGKYLLWYDERKKMYFIYNSVTSQSYAVGTAIKAMLYDEENDVPDDPSPYGVVKWMEDDRAVLIYDRYDIWKVDPENKTDAICVTKGLGRKSKLDIRYLNLDPEEKFISSGQRLFFDVFNETDKTSGWASMENIDARLRVIYAAPATVSGFVKSKLSDAAIFFQETYSNARDIYFTSSLDTSVDAGHSFSANIFTRLSNINLQQSQYLWGSASLFKWKAYTGRETEGIVYRPENFDPAKKYPLIVYFYERNSNTLYNYQAPSPTPSRLNIPFFVSRGYVVFVPDIWYTTGHPGKSAYDYIMSGTRALVKTGGIDSTKMGLQGQSWGGYQTAYLITQTNLFAAAWAGAPVVNMFSAYGGVRWESGMNRQFQYEKTQSRIGATIWEKPSLYIENSPLFHLEKVKTPLVIMSNDADGAVPWYQGIEFFTAMRRLNKPIWLLSYNGEAHNLVERRNRKDIQIREQQYFDWLLKGDKPPKWITTGVPATLKGIEFGLEPN